MLEQFLVYAEQTWQLDLNQVSQISATQLSELCEAFSINEEECVFALLPLAAEYALVPLSNYHVGAITIGLSGNAYFGANMEFGGHGLNQSVHAEQAAINHAWLSGETGIRDIYINQNPCGHCRQFMNELTTSEQLKVHVKGRESVSLAQLLPEAFGPEDLGVVNRLMSIQEVKQNPGSKNTSSMEVEAVAWTRVYSPYTDSPSICVIELDDGEKVAGCYAENAAFNPSLSPLQSALILVRLAKYDFKRIIGVELIESSLAHVKQYDTTLSMLKSIAPTLTLKYTNLAG